MSDKMSSEDLVLVDKEAVPDSYGSNNTVAGDKNVKLETTDVDNDDNDTHLSERCSEWVTGCREGCREVSAECGQLRQRCADFNCGECMRSTCSKENIKKRVPISKWLPNYSLACLQGDIIAGLTVGLTVIPQGIAYAIIAELPPQYGLYSAFMGCFIYCFLGTSKDITLGPTAIMSLMTAEFGGSPIHGDATIAIVLTLFCGIIQLVMGILNIGFLVEYISHPVINSFTTAAAITIGFGQVKKWFGLKNIPRHFMEQVYYTFKKLPETQLYDFGLGLVCMVILYGFKRSKELKIKEGNNRIVWVIIRKIVWLFATARNAIVVIVASLVAGVFYKYDMEPFSLTGNITSGLPPFRPPRFHASDGNITLTASDIFSNIGSGFAIIPIIGLIETIAIGKAFARKNNYKLDANQELLAIGAANIISSFVSSYPITGSFSRTAVNSQSGVKTPLGGVVTGALVLLSLGLLTPLFYFIPQSALAGVIIMAVIDMVDFSLLKHLWRVNKPDIIPWIFCFIFSFVLGIEWGIIIGVGINVCFLLYPMARPQIKLAKEETQYLLHNYQEAGVSEQEVIVVQFGEGLRFPGIEFVKDKITADAEDDTGNLRSVVIDFQHVSSMDYTSVHGWQSVINDFGLQGKIVVFSNLRPNLLEMFKNASLKDFRYSFSNKDAISSILEETHADINPRQSLLKADERSSIKGENGAANDYKTSDDGSHGSREIEVEEGNTEA